MAGRHVTAGELDARLAVMDSLISRLGDQVATHERWHLDMAAVPAAAAAGNRIAVAAALISAVAAAAALLTAITAMVR